MAVGSITPLSVGQRLDHSLGRSERWWTEYQLEVERLNLQATPRQQRLLPHFLVDELEDHLFNERRRRLRLPIQFVYLGLYGCDGNWLDPDPEPMLVIPTSSVGQDGDVTMSAVRAH